MGKMFLKVSDVMALLGVSDRASYQIIRDLNKELADKGYAVQRGRVSAKYFKRRFNIDTNEKSCRN